MKRDWLVHPFIFAIYPILATYAFNLGKIPSSDSYRAFAIAILLVIPVIITAWLFTREWAKASLMTSVFFVFFLSYGHIYRWSLHTLPPWFIGNQRVYIPAIWTVLLSTIIGLIWFRLGQPQAATKLANLMGLVAIALPLGKTVIFHVQTRDDLESVRVARTGNESRSEPDVPLTPTSDQLPDIYYIILDAYARADVLEDIYDYDNSEFLDFLSKKGFYIASGSPANYGSTLLSLPTSMNFRYVDDVADLLGTESANYEPLQRLIKKSAIVDSLSELGYLTVSISAGYTQVAITDADSFYIYGKTLPNQFEEIVLRNTPLGPIIDTLLPRLSGYDLARARVLYAFEQLSRMPQAPGPKFVYAHIFSPHHPFIFDPKGREVNLETEVQQFLDDDEYIPHYTGQLSYVNKLTQNAIEEILAESLVPPIIILQSDHGPDMYYEETAEDSCLQERFSILNAYYFPGDLGGQLYASISPVNSFRVLFNTYFGTKLPLLEDRTFFSYPPYLYDWSDITEQVDTCTLPASE